MTLEEGILGLLYHDCSTYHKESLEYSVYIRFPGALFTMSIYSAQGIAGVLRHVYIGSPMFCYVK
jgi:hypothetical protein